MKKHEELNKLVVAKLEWYETKGIEPNAHELFYAVKKENPIIVKRGFKSFVRIVASFPNVEKEGTPRVYKAKD